LVATRRPHLHGPDGPAWDRLAGLQPEQIADALHRGIAIGFGVFRQQLVRHQRTVRPSTDDVGEGSAAVDPEIPIAKGVSSLSCLKPERKSACGTNTAPLSSSQIAICNGN